MCRVSIRDLKATCSQQIRVLALAVSESCRYADFGSSIDSENNATLLVGYVTVVARHSLCNSKAPEG